MNKKRQSKKMYLLVLSSVFMAVVTVMTFYIKIPSHNGYIHLGDSIIYLAACILPTPYAVISAAVGGMLADAFGGYMIYMIPTLIIKGLLSLSFSSESDRILTKRNAVALVIATAITIVGYYIAEVMIVCISSAADAGAFFEKILTPVPWAAAVYCIPGNITQAVGSAIVFIILAVALDKIDIKGKI